MKILVLNGVNLNMLGKREPDIYGKKTYEDLVLELKNYVKLFKDIEIEFFQSNTEGEIVDKIHTFQGDGIVLNAGAYTHYSYAIADAIKCVKTKIIEVHISNVFAREEFRKNSVIGGNCVGSISGFGFDSYKLAIAYLVGIK